MSQSDSDPKQSASIRLNPTRMTQPHNSNPAEIRKLALMDRSLLLQTSDHVAVMTSHKNYERL